MDPRKTAFEAEQEKIQQQYQQALEQKNRLAVLKQRLRELDPEVEYMSESLQQPEEDRQAG